MRARSPRFDLAPSGHVERVVARGVLLCAPASGAIVAVASACRRRDVSASRIAPTTRKTSDVGNDPIAHREQACGERLVRERPHARMSGRERRALCSARHAEPPSARDA
jgi:hypothetical protein